MDKLIEHNENLDTPVYLPSHLASLKGKHECFEVPDLESTISRHKNLHLRLQQDIAQNKQIQCQFFQNGLPNEDTVPQIKIFSHFLLKLFRFIYQIIREQQDRKAYINSPQILTETELQPFIIKGIKKHLFYRGSTSFNITHFELINFDTKFILEHSKTSDRWPYTTPTLSSEPLPDAYSPHIPQHDTGQKILHPH